MAVPAGWLIVLSVIACAGAAGWLGVMLVDADSASADRVEVASTPSPATTAPGSATPSPTPSPTQTTATPEPTVAASTPSPTAEPVRRAASVSVLNNTGIANLAGAYAGKVSAAGWVVSGRGNWRGQIVSNTVYYPDGLQDQAELLASDVGIERVLPSIVPMRMDRLTIILSGPQQ